MLEYDPIKIGEKLYAYRKRIGLTQADVAERASISDRAYAEIERGQARMRLETLVRLCNVLSIMPNDLFIDIDEPTMEKCKELYAKFNELSSNEREHFNEFFAILIKS